MSTERISGYQPERTIADISISQARALIDDARKGALSYESAAGAERFTAHTFTLSGGGPASDITFVLDSDEEVREAFFTYYEIGGSHAVRLDGYDAQEVYDGLNSEPREENDDDEDEED